MSSGKLARVTITIPRGLLDELDELARRFFGSRSRAIAEAVRRLVDSMRLDAGGSVVGTLSYCYEGHRTAERLRELGHAYRDLIVSTLHFHVSESECLEVLVLRGDAKRAEQLLSELGKVKGVKHISVSLVRAGPP